MAYLIFMGITFALFAGFFVLINYEMRHGVRFGADHRTRLDAHVERIEFILAHIDLGAFLHGEVRHLFSRIWHDSVHISLLSVRAVERLLTRLVRHQHAQNEVEVVPLESTREFVKTLSEFKEQLDATHPEISDIESK